MEILIFLWGKYQIHHPKYQMQQKHHPRMYNFTGLKSYWRRKNNKYEVHYAKVSLAPFEEKKSFGESLKVNWSKSEFKHYQLLV